MKKLGLLSLVATTALMASGYKVPEQSVNATALAGAYVANASGADASYYNPANMAFMDQRSYFEADLTYIHLTAIDYKGTATNSFGVSADASASSKREDFLLPAFHYVGKAYGDYRFGLSLTIPAGLSKRWQEGGASTLKSEEFTLHVVELNPVVSYKATDNLSIAAGLRFVHSKGVVTSEGTTQVAATPLYQTINREMRGSGLAFGYNLALSYKPVDEVTLAATYRSKVDLELKGEATLSASNTVTAAGALAAANASWYNGSTKVTVPLPAVLSLATAYDINENTTVELEYERVYWSAYRELDFGGYDSVLSATLKAAFDDPKAKNWKDSNTYRIGVTHKFDDTWTGMAGYAYDETPVPASTASFELPDSNAHLFALGARYQYSKDLSLGMSLLYDQKKSLTLNETEHDGRFKDASAYLVTLGMSYNY